MHVILNNRKIYFFLPFWAFEFVSVNACLQTTIQNNAFFNKNFHLREKSNPENINLYMKVQWQDKTEEYGT